MRKAYDATNVIGIVVKRWPRLSETFVLNEILGLERAGLRLHIYALMDPREPAAHGAVSDVRAPVSYLRTGTRADVVSLLLAQLRMLEVAPVRYLRTAAYVMARRRHVATFLHFFEAARLVALLHRDGVTQLHAQFAHGPTSVAHFAYLLSGTPFSFTGHAKDIYLSPPDLLAVKIAAASFVATCTQHNVEHLRDLAAPQHHDNIHLIYHGVDTDRFRPAAAAAAVGATDDPAVRMIAVGRLVEKKGYPYLIRACGLLHQRGYRFNLDIYGTGPQEAELDSLIRSLDLQEVVKLRGARTQDELIEIYQNAAVFVLAPHVMENGDRDGIPNVLMEAMSAGLPVVATSISGIPELIDDERSGLLVPQRDEEALAASLARLLDPRDGPALRMQLGAAGREWTIARFEATLHIGRMVELLQTGAASVPRPTPWQQAPAQRELQPGGRRR